MARTKSTSIKAEGDTAATALLIIDMISAWDFADGSVLLDAALRIAPRIAALKRR